MEETGKSGGGGRNSVAFTEIQARDGGSLNWWLAGDW